MNWERINTISSGVLRKNRCNIARVVIGTAASGCVLSIYDGIDNSGRQLPAIDCSSKGPIEFKATFDVGCYYTMTGDSPADVAIIF